MLRVLVEEYARMGCDLDAIMDLACDPFYQAFHGLRQLLGDDELRRRVADILQRCGVTRTTTEVSEGYQKRPARKNFHYTP